MRVTTLHGAQCVLGESPVWHNSRQSCFWVDIHAGSLYELNWETKHVNVKYIGRNLSLIIEAADYHLILAVAGGVIKLDLESGEEVWLADLDKNIPNNRCNDGACDLNGRLWIGTMDRECEAGAGSLYRINKDTSIEKVLDHLTIPNGLVWSLDRTRMYFIDSASLAVKSYSFNSETGAIADEKIVVQIPEALGLPDGMTIDAEGMLWIAIYGGYGIGRWNPEDGKLLDWVKLPAPKITNCHFAGAQLDQLIVTSAREGLTAQQLADYPESGNVFLISDLNVKGIKPVIYS